jgi:hypothetical protein
VTPALFFAFGRGLAERLSTTGEEEDIERAAARWFPERDVPA